MKKILMFLIILMMFSAFGFSDFINYYDSRHNGFSGDQTGAESSQKGMCFFVNESTYLINVTGGDHTGANCDKVRLAYASDGGNIALSTDKNGLNWSFNVLLNVSTEYCVLIDDSGSGCIKNQNGGATIPQIDGRINFTRGGVRASDSGAISLQNPNEVYGVAGITTATFLEEESDYVNLTTPTPDNNTIQNLNYFYINTTLSQIEVDECKLDLNGTNESMNVYDGDIDHCFLNKTSLSDGSYYYSVWAKYTGDNWVQSEIRYITIDSLYPIITWVSPNNNISVMNNFTLNATVSDINLDIVNITLYNSTEIVFNNQTIGINETIYNINHYVNFSYGYDNYTFEVCALDDHTYGSLNGLTYEINNDNIEFCKNEKCKQIKIAYWDNEIKFLSETQINNFDINFEIETKKGEYKFNLSFLRPSQNFKFGFIIPKINDLRVIKDGHVVWNDYYIDFFDLEKTGFPITIKENDDYYFVYSNTVYCNSNIGEKCILDPIIGGVNKICDNLTFEYVPNIAPSINIYYPINNSNFSKSLSNVTFECSDVNNNGNSVYIYFDDVLIDNLNFSNTTLEINYNNYSNGTHNITISCDDVEFNTSQTIYFSLFENPIISNKVFDFNHFININQLTIPLILFIGLLYFLGISLIVLGIIYGLFLFQSFGTIFLMVCGIVVFSTISAWIGIFTLFLGITMLFMIGIINFKSR